MLTLAAALAEDLVPRLLAAPLRSAQGSAVLGAADGRPADADSPDAGPSSHIEPGDDDAFLVPAVPQAQRQGWLQRFGSAVGFSTLPSVSHEEDSAYPEPNETARRQPDAGGQSAESDVSTGDQDDDAVPVRTAMASWRRRVDAAASAARHVQAALLGYRPFPALAHFGSHTLLHAVPAQMHAEGSTPVAGLQQPAQR